MTAPTASTRRPTTHAAPRDWRNAALCRDNPDLWFPNGKTGHHLVQIRKAKQICRTCPVMQLCGQWAIDTRQEYGIFGGMDEHERRVLLRRIRRIATPRSDRKWVRILRDRLPEYQGLVAQGLQARDIAKQMDTTVQTINSVRRALEQQDLVVSA
ncbi:WhiB family transcriptional regulator [Streptomyces asiaticus]|uniref:WhiB family transcriptional regulator n=1 Tax=Streptomyces asiaticus TaxID=114695 RepID=UPI00382D1056